MLLLIGLYSCSKEPQNQAPADQIPDENALLINHDGISISETEASQVAALFLKNDPTTKSTSQNKTVKSINTILDENGNPLMHVVNFEPTGFTIISATKNYAPILAYSEESNYSLDENNGAKIWIDETKNAIKSCTDLPTEEIFKNRIQWIKYEKSSISNEPSTRYGSVSQAFHNRVSQLRNSNPGYNFYPLSNVGSSMFPLSNTYDDLCRLADGYNSPREYTIIGIKSEYTTNTIGPLLTTRWNQDENFNDHLPSDDYLVGCVTVAVGQIINFHKSPSSYNWNNIPDNYATDETRRLLYDIANSLNIKYKSGTNSATDGEAKRAFEDFGYNATLGNHNVLNVENEIYRYRRPVYMSGMDRLLFPSIGHAWVCDGTRIKNTTTDYLVEFLHGGPGYYNFSDYGHYPSRSSFEYLDFHMNWG